MAYVVVNHTHPPNWRAAVMREHTFTILYAQGYGALLTGDLNLPFHPLIAAYSQQASVK